MKFDFSISIPTQNMKRASLNVQLSCLATMIALQQQLSELYHEIDSNTDPKDIFRHYEQVAVEKREELKVDFFAAFGQ